MDWGTQKGLVAWCRHQALEQLKLDLENPDFLSRLFALQDERLGEGFLVYGDEMWSKDDDELEQEEMEEFADLLNWRSCRYAKNLPEGDRNAAEGYYDPEDDRFTKWG